MEILSTGEKIKRSRIYKGITLKELCGNEISISKMSCIENGKVKADRHIVEYIAGKIGIDFDYLIQDVYEQISSNLALIKKDARKNEDYEENVRHNLSYAVKYEYNNLAIELIHILFNYYLEGNKYENIQLIISQYYDLYQKVNTEENTIFYFRDMARYLAQNNENTEAIAYYGRLREYIASKCVKNNNIYSSIAYNEGICYCKLHVYDKAYDLLSEAIKYIDQNDSDLTKGRVYHAYALVCIRLAFSEADEYISKAYEYQKDNPIMLAISRGAYGEAYFAVGEEEKAIEEILAGIEIFPPHNKEKYVTFLNGCIDILFKNGQYQKAYELDDRALNYAIETDNITLIERAYYLKGSILQKEGKNNEAEMYMNLALDSLMKFGSKEQRHDIYLDMANLYYNLGKVKDAIQYFTLAIKLEEII